MGYYIGCNRAKNKAEQICVLHGGVIIPPPARFENVPADKALIIVLDNGPFEAAAFVYDAHEFSRFMEPSDHRHRDFVLMDRKKAEKLSGFSA